jgi:hypothetical protein
MAVDAPRGSKGRRGSAAEPRIDDGISKISGERFRKLPVKPPRSAAANNAMRQAVRKIVMDVERATLEIHWHHIAVDTEPQVLPLVMFGKLPTQKRQRRKRKSSVDEPLGGPAKARRRAAPDVGAATNNKPINNRRVSYK